MFKREITELARYDLIDLDEQSLLYIERYGYKASCCYMTVWTYNEQGEKVSSSVLVVLDPQNESASMEENFEALEQELAAKLEQYAT
jgi:hypothetical protein